MDKSHKFITAVTVILSIILGFVVSYYLNSKAETMMGAFLWLSLIILPLCILLTMVTPMLPWLCPIFVVSGLYLGIGTDAILDEQMDRNLWLMEALIAHILSLPALLICFVAGIMKARKRNLKDIKIMV